MNSRFLDILGQRVLFFDGAMGTAIHARNLSLSDYDGRENCIEILNLTRPEVIEEIHASFLGVGCDAVETNTFGGMKHVLAEFGLADRCREINHAAAEIARRAVERFDASDHPRFVVGSMGPGNKLPTLRQIDWDTLEDSYAEAARGLIEGGVDVLMIETCQDILQAKAAIVAAVRAMNETRRAVPLMVSVTMESFGTMLIGTDVPAAVTALEAYPEVSAVGINCATGPQEMSEHLRYLSQHCSRFLSVMPNAGLPQIVDGRPHYTLSPTEFARWLKEFVETDGVNVVGGCCGTTPEHLAAAIKTIGRRPPIPRRPVTRPGASSVYVASPFKQETSFLMIGERTNTNGSRKFKHLLQAEDLHGMVQMAKDQVREGAHVLDVCVAYVGRDEETDMKQIIGRLAAEVTAPLMIDSTEPTVIEAALKQAGGRCIINSINLEDGEDKFDRLCQLARRYGAAVVALTIDEQGMAKDADRKIQIARRIVDRCTKHHGLQPHDVIIDALTFTICTGQSSDHKLAHETLLSIQRIKNEIPGVFTSLGVSNVSFGLDPAVRSTLNSVFLHEAVRQGLDAAIIHVAGIMPLHKIPDSHRRLAEDLIYDRRRFDPDGHCTYDPLRELIRLFSQKSDQPSVRVEAPTVEERLKNRIIDGNRSGMESDLDEALRQYSPTDVINRILLEGMKVVGDLFGSGQMQLPFVLQSAETMKAAVAYLELRMEKTTRSSRGKIVLATVKGDVHDIGKNLVDIILSNNGYTVYNLGIKQPINTIIEKYREMQADAIGMSGLLVKSTQVMKDNLEVLKERGIDVPVVLGGAALNRRYVEENLRPIYEGPLYYAQDAFEGLALMQQITQQSPDSASPATENTLSRTSRSSPGVVRGSEIRIIRSRDNPIPQPPFWGQRVVDRIPLSAVLPLINEVMLFQVQWQYKRNRRSDVEFKKYIDAEVRPIYRELVARCERDDILQPRAIYGYWPCNSDGNDLIIFHPDEPKKEIVRFVFPREKEEPHRCIADYFCPFDSGEKDVVAFSVATVGSRVSEAARRLFQENRYRDYLYLHGLGVTCAEALGEYVHRQIRTELGIANRDAPEQRELFQQGYQGSRYGFGYPACPNLEDQAKLWPLLHPEDIGVSLTEGFQLVPEQTVTALICHHPDAKYFNAK